MTRMHTATYALLCVLYLLAMQFEPFPFHVLVKAAPIALLIGFGIKAYGRNQCGFPIVAIGALVFSAAGDIFIEFTFLYGLLAFAGAQLCYASVFYRYRQSPRQYVLSLSLLTLIFVTIGYVLAQAAGEMAGFILFYAFSIYCMAATALLASNASRLILIGALIFVVSDALIGISRFIVPFAYSGLLIMVTYYLAQFFLFKGILELVNVDSGRNASPHVHSSPV